MWPHPHASGSCGVWEHRDAGQNINRLARWMRPAADRGVMMLFILLRLSSSASSVPTRTQDATIAQA